MQTQLDIHAKICSTEHHRKNSVDKSMRQLADSLNSKYSENELTQLFIHIKEGITKHKISN